MKPSPLTPLEKVAPDISAAPKVAGGIASILSAMKHAFGQIGIIRGTKTLLRLNQIEGFDCPGCAWPDPDKHRSHTEFCENGAKVVAAEATSKKVTPEFFAEYSIASLSEKSDHWLSACGRITHPMVKIKGAENYREISWEEAFSLIANELHSLASPDEATFYTSGRTSNEAAFLYQLIVRLYGTNNLPDCSNLCHESSGVALSEAVGIGKGSVTLEDFDFADCILIIGQNPATCHPRMLEPLLRASRRSCAIISINPLQEVGLSRFKHPREIFRLLGNGTSISSIHLPVKINGDVALLKGIMKEMLAAEECNPGMVFDKKFIAEHTLGFEAFLDDIRNCSWDQILQQSGITREQISQVTMQLTKSKRLIACWAMGLTQHENAIANIQEVVNLLLLGGHFGRPGAGACPVRGHSNVQGDRTMGIVHNPKASFLAALAKEFSFSPPKLHGLDAVDSLKAMHEGKVQVFFALGGNFLSASPDTEYAAEALQRCRLTVQISTQLNRSHLITGETALILPCLGRSEEDLQSSGPQMVTAENSMGVLQSSRGRLKPASKHLKSEVAILTGLAKVLFSKQQDKLARVNWDAWSGNYDLIRDSVERTIEGFENFNARVRKPGGFHLFHPVRDKLSFNTPSGKAHFNVHAIPSRNLSKGRYLLTTIRSHDQFNTSIYGLNDRYRGIAHGRRIVIMNSDDMKEQGLSEGMAVDITSHFSGETRRALKFIAVPYQIPRQNVAAYFPEANVLVPVGFSADKSNTPAYKSIEVSIQASEVTA